MSRRSTRKKASTPEVDDEVIDAKQQKLSVVGEGEEESAIATNENEPPKPAVEEKSSDGGDPDARGGTEKLRFRILHCTSWSVFKRNANAVGDALRQHFGDVELSLNPDGKPKRGSFEIILMKEEKDVLLWSGVEKGPPRKLKFPETSKVVELINGQI